jgi:hypothetical protein
MEEEEEEEQARHGLPSYWLGFGWKKEKLDTGCHCIGLMVGGRLTVMSEKPGVAFVLSLYRSGQLSREV